MPRYLNQVRIETAANVAPLIVSSATMVANLNAERVGGKYWTELLDAGATAQSKTGNLSLGGSLTLTGLGADYAVASSGNRVLALDDGGGVRKMTPAFARGMLDAYSKAECNSLFAASGHSHPWGDITGKPATFPADPHTHAYADITGKPGGTAGRFAHWGAGGLGDSAELWLDGAGKVTVSSSGSNKGLGVWGQVYATGGFSSNGVAVVLDNDARMTNARTPTAHGHGIGDLPVAANGVSSATALVRADDSRLNDSRTPTAHTHAWSEITSKPATFPPESHSHSYLPLAGGSLSGGLTVGGALSLSNLGADVSSGAGYKVLMRADSGYGVRAITLDGLKGYIDAAPSSHTHAASAITSGVVAPARLGSGTPTASNFLRGDGQWATPSTANGAVARGGFSINSFGNVTGFWGNVSSVTWTGTANEYLVTHGAGVSHLAIVANGTTGVAGMSVSAGITYVDQNSFKVSLGATNPADMTGCYFAIFA